jgi:hypothetical protein
MGRVVLRVKIGTTKTQDSKLKYVYKKRRDLPYSEEKRDQIVAKCTAKNLWMWDPLFPTDPRHTNRAIPPYQFQSTHRRAIFIELRSPPLPL